MERKNLDNQPMAISGDGTLLAIETPLSEEIEKFVSEVLADEKTKEKPELIKALAELLNVAYVH